MRTEFFIQSVMRAVLIICYVFISKYGIVPNGFGCVNEILFFVLFFHCFWFWIICFFLSVCGFFALLRHTIFVSGFRLWNIQPFNVKLEAIYVRIQLDKGI